MGGHQAGAGSVVGGGPGGQPSNVAGGAGAAANTIELCERIKEEYQFLNAQNQQLKMEIEKLAQEKSEMQRHYVMVISYVLCQAYLCLTIRYCNFCC